MERQEFYRPLPYSVMYKGRKYDLTPAYDNVLTMFKDVEGVPMHRVPEIMGYYLLRKPSTDAGLLQTVSELLFQPAKTTHQKSMDFIQDGPLIYAAFMQAYGMDLQEQRGILHWWKFNALLRGLPSNTRLMEVVQIRTKPMPAPNRYNAQERAELARLKQEFALELTEAEREEQLQSGLRNMAQMLLQMAANKEQK